MARIQLSKGSYRVSVPMEIMRLQGWRKGTELIWIYNPKRTYIKVVAKEE